MAGSWLMGTLKVMLGIKACRLLPCNRPCHQRYNISMYVCTSSPIIIHRWTHVRSKIREMHRRKHRLKYFINNFRIYVFKKSLTILLINRYIYILYIYFWNTIKTQCLNRQFHYDYVLSAYP